MRSSLSLLLCAICASAGDKIPIYFSFISSKTGPFVSSGAIPMVEYALEEINNSTEILQNYTLMHSEILDSNCDVSASLDAFFTLFKNDSQPNYLALLGCGCLPATRVVALISYQWNIPQLSFSAGDETLANRSRYKSFISVLGTLEYYPPTLLRIALKFKWKQLAMITQEEIIFLRIRRKMKELFDNAGIILNDTITVKSNFDWFPQENILAWENEATYRIIYINSYNDIAYRILCEAYKRNMLWPKYVWILFGRIEWKTMGTSYCPSDYVETALNGSLRIVSEGFHALGNGSYTSYTGLVKERFIEIYHNLLSFPKYRQYSQFALDLVGVAYDSMWAIGFGLDRASKRISAGDDSGCEHLHGQLVPLENFTYDNEKLGCVIQQSFLNLSFNGITGSFEIGPNGNRPSNVISMNQYRCSIADGLEEVPVFKIINYRNMNKSVFEFALNESEYTIWGGIPYDGFTIDVIHPVNIFVSVIFHVAASLGLIFAGVCFFFNLFFRNRKLVKLTSPNLNYIVIIGAVLLYTSIYFIAYSFTQFDQVLEQTIFCNLQLWLPKIGDVLCFAVLLAKSWRIYYIFTNPNVKKKAIKDWMLYIIVFVILAIKLMFLIIGTAVPSVIPKAMVMLDELQSFTITTEGTLERNFFFHCEGQHTIALLIALFVYKAILHIVGIFLAFHTRRVRIKSLNDSKRIAALIYINSILLIVLLVTRFSLTEFHEVFVIIECLNVLIEASLFLGVLFIPTMFELYKDPSGKNIFEDQSNRIRQHRPSDVSHNNKTTDTSYTDQLKTMAREPEQCNPVASTYSEANAGINADSPKLVTVKFDVH